MASCSRSEERLVNEQRRADLIKTRAAGATVPQGTARQRRLRRPSPLRIAFVLSIVVAACAAGILALAGRSLRPVEARDVVPPTTAPSTTTVSNGSSFIPSIGLTRTQVESLFREIDGSHTVFRAARRVARHSSSAGIGQPLIYDHRDQRLSHGHRRAGGLDTRNDQQGNA